MREFNLRYVLVQVTQAPNREAAYSSLGMRNVIQTGKGTFPKTKQTNKQKAQLCSVERPHPEPSASLWGLFTPPALLPGPDRISLHVHEAGCEPS